MQPAWACWSITRCRARFYYINSRPAKVGSETSLLLGPGGGFWRSGGSLGCVRLGEILPTARVAWLAPPTISEGRSESDPLNHSPGCLPQRLDCGNNFLSTTAQLWTRIRAILDRGMMVIGCAREGHRGNELRHCGLARRRVGAGAVCRRDESN